MASAPQNVTRAVARTTFAPHALNGDVSLTALSGGHQGGEITTKTLKKFLERDSRCAIVRMKTPVDAPDHGDAIGCSNQLRSRLRIRRGPALQRQQAYDHLQVVQESMIGLAAQEGLILNCLIFLTKQALIKSDDLSQLEFGPPISFQFAFIACCRAVLRASIWSSRSYFYALKNMLHG
jgi:hypothetical protein